MSESRLQAAVQKRLRERGCVVLKVHGGPYQPTALDLVGCRPDGRAFTVEVKVDGNHVTPRQQRVIEQWQRAGALAGVAYSVVEAEALVFEGLG
jgi:hypothetical protein